MCICPTCTTTTVLCTLALMTMRLQWAGSRAGEGLRRERGDGQGKERGVILGTMRLQWAGSRAGQGVGEREGQRTMRMQWADTRMRCRRAEERLGAGAAETCWRKVKGKAGLQSRCAVKPYCWLLLPSAAVAINPPHTARSHRLSTSPNSPVHPSCPLNMLQPSLSTLQASTASHLPLTILPAGP